MIGNNFIYFYSWQWMLLRQPWTINTTANENVMGPPKLRNNFWWTFKLLDFPILWCHCSPSNIRSSTFGFKKVFSFYLFASFLLMAFFLYCSQYSYHSSKYRDSYSHCSKWYQQRKTIFYASITIAIVGRAIIVERAIKKRSKELIQEV